MNYVQFKFFYLTILGKNVMGFGFQVFSSNGVSVSRKSFEIDFNLKGRLSKIYIFW